FDQVLMNPPIRAGKAVIERLVAEATSRLFPTGELWLVVRTAHGAKSLQRWLQERFGPVEEAAKGSGYRVFRLRPDFGAPGTISPGGAWEGGPGADTK
ncbi:MAG TPA: methyltransferase, partial [Limnochordia bacterium]